MLVHVKLDPWIVYWWMCHTLSVNAKSNENKKGEGVQG
jgi:hypothetical protein